MTTTIVAVVAPIVMWLMAKFAIMALAVVAEQPALQVKFVPKEHVLLIIVPGSPAHLAKPVSMALVLAMLALMLTAPLVKFVSTGLVSEGIIVLALPANQVKLVGMATVLLFAIAQLLVLQANFVKMVFAWLIALRRVALTPTQRAVMVPVSVIRILPMTAIIAAPVAINAAPINSAVILQDVSI